MEDLTSGRQSLRKRVYEHLKEQINSQKIRQGSFLDLNTIGKELALSRTPLRDALFQLEFEGFVSIYPRRGVFVNVLDLKSIRNIYEVIGALESACLINVAVKLTAADISQMEVHNEAMRSYLEQDNFAAHYEQNVCFHNIFLNLSENADLIHTARILRERLYDFPRNPGFLKDWELSNLEEHRQMVKKLRDGDFNGAAEYLRDVHWSFSVQERYIRKYYFASKTNIREK